MTGRTRLRGKDLRIPRDLPMLWDEQRNAYRDPRNATAGEWRQAKRAQHARPNWRAALHQATTRA
jgi:hypothetical protein